MAELISRDQIDKIFADEKAARPKREEEALAKKKETDEQLKEIENNLSKEQIADSLFSALEAADESSKKILINMLSNSVNGKHLQCVDKAPVLCEFGSKMAKLKASNQGVMKTGEAALHDEDTSIEGDFGICKATKKKCAYAPAPRWLVTNEYTVISNHMDIIEQKRLQAIKKRILKQSFVEEPIAPLKENNTLTTGSVLACMAQGGIIYFLDSGQLQKYMTEDEYYQYMLKIGLYRALGSYKKIYFLNVKDRMLSGELFNGKFYLNDLDDMKYLLDVLGVSKSDRSKYVYKNLNDLFKELNIKYDESSDFPGWQIKVKDEELTVLPEDEEEASTSLVRSAVWEKELQSNKNIRVVLSVKANLKFPGKAKGDIIKETKGLTKDALSKIKFNFEKFYVWVSEDVRRLEFGTKNVAGFVVSIGIDKKGINLKLEIPLAEDLLKKYKFISGSIRLTVSIKFQQNKTPQNLKKILENAITQVDTLKCLFVWVKTISDEVADEIQDMDGIMKQLNNIFQNISEEIAYTIAAGIILTIIITSVKILA